ncbi:NAD-dependent epimerase/dehydratase family protein [Egicoccus sp. AB-alg6-2]|uniref:NAD-dependent epimerase/dehydratase family protein n=1 Tax=Egicoccus sp. AB-alg6-2 TaxID=3242692 RepID=UPI00359E2BBC
MEQGRRVLVTGVAGDLAGLVTAALERRDDVAAIFGVDVRTPSTDLQRTEFVRADVRNPVVARLLTTERIDTVLHMSTASTPARSGGRAMMKERNVIGAMQLLAACQNTPTLRRFVLKSTAAVYGSEHTDPVSFRETDLPRTPPRHGYAKDASEIETYARSFARRRTDVELTVLRFANFVGGHLDSAFSALFSLPAVPTVLGYDPRLQFCHEEDAVAVLERVTCASHPGTYNVAGDGVVYLSQAIRLAGRVPAPVPQPFVDVVAGMVRRSGRLDVSAEQLRFLQFGRVIDTTRLREDVGYVPRWSSRAAFEDLVRQRRIRGLLAHDDVRRLEREVNAFLARQDQRRFLAGRSEGQP